MSRKKNSGWLRRYARRVAAKMARGLRDQHRREEKRRAEYVRGDRVKR
jgi:hypothetical protein